MNALNHAYPGVLSQKGFGRPSLSKIFFTAVFSSSVVRPYPIRDISCNHFDSMLSSAGVSTVGGPGRLPRSTFSVIRSCRIAEIFFIFIVLWRIMLVCLHLGTLNLLPAVRIDIEPFRTAIIALSMLVGFQFIRLPGCWGVLGIAVS